MDLLKLLYENIVENRHCILRSGKHSDKYIEKTKITLYQRLYSDIIYSYTDLIIRKYKLNEYDVITGPAVAGICFAAPIAVELGRPLIFLEKKIISDGLLTKTVMYLRKPFVDFIENKNVIIIEDIVTTGGSIIKTAESIINSGGNPIAAFCLWNRSNIDTLKITVNNIDYELNLYNIIKEEIPSWNENECYCNKGIK